MPSMVDFMNPRQRSRAMSKVQGTNTKIEQTVRSLLHRRGFRFRKNVKTLPGRPDIVLPKYHAVIFVHGCFWHAHEGCKKSTIPGTRREFWEQKIQGNKDRDRRDIQELQEQGWRVAVVWECALKKKESIERTITELGMWITSKIDLCEIPKNLS